jgi:hypothetical protein
LPFGEAFFLAEAGFDLFFVGESLFDLDLEFESSYRWAVVSYSRKQYIVGDLLGRRT